MYSDESGILNYLAAARQASTGTADSYVLLAKRLYLGTSAVDYSEAVPMEGFNAIFVECTVLAATGAPDPSLTVYVQVSNDRQNWSTLPLGGTAVFMNIAVVGYMKLDQSAIGQQISAAYVRLKYQTDSWTATVIFSAGIDRKRQGT